MGSVHVNQLKRAEMSTIVRKLRALGWTPAQLAHWMRCSVSTIHTWSRGASMGTNAQRAELHLMATVPMADWPRRFRESIIAQLREAKMCDRMAIDAHTQDADLVARDHERKAARYRKRAVVLEALAVQFEHSHGGESR